LKIAAKKIDNGTRKRIETELVRIAKIAAKKIGNGTRKRIETELVRIAKIAEEQSESLVEMH
jgi:hypothetical protein